MSLTPTNVASTARRRVDATTVLVGEQALVLILARTPALASGDPASRSSALQSATALAHHAGSTCPDRAAASSSPLSTGRLTPDDYARPPAFCCRRCRSWLLAAMRFPGIW
ncbi:MAG TPA: hypothetical protein VFV38_21460 [Ktedonobacteraceae bacterium]|nr:hypothetical protein [Ktedonobacteraceae bacterium]